MESSRYNVDHGLRTPNEAFWAWTDNMGRYILGHLGYFWPIYQHPFWYCESLVHVFHFGQPLFLQKTKPLYQNPKYLFGIGILIWVAKN